MEVFRVADIDKDGSLDENEWRAFYIYFIQPFEECLDKTQEE